MLEPIGNNTATAMALAALVNQHSQDPSDLLLFSLADHHIPDKTSFLNSLQNGFHAAHSGAIFTFGVIPTLPFVAYGYIEVSKISDDGSNEVGQFI